MQEVLKMFKIHFSNTPTEKMSQQGNMFMSKKRKDNTLRFTDNITKGTQGLQCNFLFLFLHFLKV